MEDTSLKTSPSTDRSVIAHAYLLAHEFEHAHVIAAQTQVLGWSNSYNELIIHMLDDGITKLWWVASDNLGDTPFRWNVYDVEGGELLVTSEEFGLPTQNKQTVVVEVTLP